MMRLKVLLVGASKSGKTRIANILSEAVEEAEAASDHRPTQGVRILEYEPPSTISSKWVAELWDCSADQKFESCWPAFQHGAHAAILVVDPSKPELAKSAADRFSPLLPNRPPGQGHCLVILTSATPPTPLKLRGAWGEARQVRSEAAKDGGQALRREVAAFLSDLAEAATDRDEFSFVAGIN